ncbi:hydroxyacid dehydrogenase [Candidatus Woesearchaeota archaeon]|nr:MAG: hydroxyacid dehydrogenase [Candidatus Woesearchaeota archaeon]
MRIVFFEVHDWEKAFLEDKLREDGHSFYACPLQDAKREEFLDAEAICTFIYSKVTRDVIEALPQLKLIVTRSTGYDHIDLAACRERGITVCNVPSYGENTVAEHTFALILNLSRNVHKSYLRTIQNDFRIDDLRGFDLKGKTLGVIGAGHIGLHVIKIAKGFGMHVLAFDPKPQPFIADILHYRYASLDEIYTQSDIITLHVPLNEHTRHLINAEAIAKMNGVIIINTSRGEVIDTDALYEGLKSGRIKGAGLDVIEQERLITEEHQLLAVSPNKQDWKTLYENQEILKMPNVVFTPHNAFNSQEALERILETTVENITAYAHGRPTNTVT